MQFLLDYPHVFRPGATDEDNAMCLRGLLEALTMANMVYLRRYPRTPRLYQSGVRYAKDPVWLSIPALYGKRFGDCKSLTAAFVAEERIAGREARPVFRPMYNPRKQQNDFHILVQTPRGFEDPSRRLGMDEYFRRRGIGAFPQ
jgi:hypothetical protein